MVPVNVGWTGSEGTEGAAVEAGIISPCIPVTTTFTLVPLILYCAFILAAGRVSDAFLFAHSEVSVPICVRVPATFLKLAAS